MPAGHPALLQLPADCKPQERSAAIQYRFGLRSPPSIRIRPTGNVGKNRCLNVSKQRVWDARVPAVAGGERIRAAIVFGAREPVMVERRRKHTYSHKSAARKVARQTRRTRAQKPGTVRKETSARKSAAKPSPKRWSQRVTQGSDALDLRHGVFKLTDPKKIAASLKRSAERSSRRKTSAYRSALSMLTFYINRAGKTLPKPQRERLQRAKTELKHQFGRA
jgi:hypothetical protein